MPVAAIQTAVAFAIACGVAPHYACTLQRRIKITFLLVFHVRKYREGRILSHIKVYLCSRDARDCLQNKSQHHSENEGEETLFRLRDDLEVSASDASRKT
jgi:hypothetical protein